MIARLVVAVLALADTSAGQGKSVARRVDVPVARIDSAARRVDASVARIDSATRRVDPPWWELRADAAAESFTARLPAWQRHTLSLQRRAAWGAVTAEAFVARRFDRWERGGAIEGAATTWRGAYVDARAAVAPGALVVPRLDATAELFQGVVRGWELSPGVRLLRYADADVPIYSFGVARYAGDWYVRGRATAAPRAGQVGASGGLVVRRYLGNATELVEASAVAGRDVVTLAPGVTELRASRAASVRVQRMVTAKVGASGALSVADEGGLPGRRGVEVGVFFRW